MKVFLLGLTLIFGSALSTAAQSGTYQFDNFDIANGIRIEKPVVNPPVKEKRLTSRLSAISRSTAATDTPSPKALTELTSLAVNAVSRSLDSFTTGNSSIDSFIVESGSRNGVDPVLLYAIMHQESTFKAKAVSPKGARGLMQLMPFTAMRYGVTNIFDPRQNIEGGARYVRFLLDRFDGDISLVLAGYNAGEGAVDKYGWHIPPYSETQEYVRRISRRYAVLRDPNAALYAPRVARMQDKQSAPLTVYERTVSTVRLPDGKLQLMSQ